jgi:hypothetical protein
VKFFGSASRFRGFINSFFPPAPSVRSEPPFSQVEWTIVSMSKALSRIYQHRSNALHAGIPFPPPMYWPPMVITGAVPAERPLGGGTHGGRWSSDDCPMHLHVFEHIARQTLVAWWRASANAGDGTV